MYGSISRGSTEGPNLYLQKSFIQDIISPTEDATVEMNPESIKHVEHDRN